MKKLFAMILLLLFLPTIGFSQRIVGFAVKPADGGGPVQVISTTSDGPQGIVTKAGLSFNTQAKSRGVAAVKYGWKVFNPFTKEVLGNYQSDFIKLNKFDKKAKLGRPLFSLNEFLREKQIGNNSNIVVEISINEVQFEDGGTWATPFSEFNGLYAFSLFTQENEESSEGCQNQICDYHTPQDSFRCVDWMNYTCSVSEDGHTCTSKKCAGGGGEIELEM